jgi:hypothetical protein
MVEGSYSGDRNGRLLVPGNRVRGDTTYLPSVHYTACSNGIRRIAAEHHT